jgi:hypothetical protein
MLQHLLMLPSLQDNRDSRQPPFFSLQEVLQQHQDLWLQRFRLRKWA